MTLPIFSTTVASGHNRVFLIPLIADAVHSPQFIPMLIKGIALSRASNAGKHANAVLDTDLTVDENGIVNGTAIVLWPDEQPDSMVQIEKSALAVTTGESVH